MKKLTFMTLNGQIEMPIADEVNVATMLKMGKADGFLYNFDAQGAGVCIMWDKILWVLVNQAETHAQPEGRQ